MTNTLDKKKIKFLVTKTNDGVRLTALSENEEDLRFEEYELHDKEIIILKGNYPKIGRFDL